MIVDRISAFVAGSRDFAFEELTAEALTFQVERIPALRRLCEHRSILPGALQDWRQVPPIPSSAFKSMRLCAGEARETFRSSGTTAGERRSVHHHPFPELYRQVIDASFPVFCLPRLAHPPTLSLVPPRELVPDSSLSFMVDHILRRHAGEDCTLALGEGGIQLEEAMGWLERRRTSGEPGLVLATALALLELLDGLETHHDACPMPPGSVVFETGGFKGRHREVTREELLRKLSRGLGVDGHFVVREYGMTELTSQAYTRTLFGDDPDLFFCPPWVRAHTLDPATLEELPPGATGLLALFDLANVGSALHLLTEDLSVMDAESGGFRLAGRAAGAELRGCSLTVEELSRS